MSPLRELLRVQGTCGMGGVQARECMSGHWETGEDADGVSYFLSWKTEMPVVGPSVSAQDNKLHSPGSDKTVLSMESLASSVDMLTATGSDVRLGEVMIQYTRIYTPSSGYNGSK